jgi:hypothetical protein
LLTGRRVSRSDITTPVHGNGIEVATRDPTARG